MRLPTIGQFKLQVNSLSKQIEQLRPLQAQIATGKKIERGSDDPTLASRIKAMEDQLKIQKSFELNNTLAENHAALASNRIQEGVNIIAQIQQLIQTAQNETLSKEGKQIIATQLQAHLSSLLQIANTQDSNDEYLFSGLNTHTPPFQQNSSSFVYQGSQEASLLAIGYNQKVAFNDSGQEIFGGIYSGNGLFSVACDALNNTGTGVIRSLQASPDFVSDEYTLTFIANSQGELAYQVIGLNSGQLIPVPPDDAPAYQSGELIHFNGVSLQMSGHPTAGDTFYVTPSEKRNVFDALQNLINDFTLPFDTAKQKADFHQALSEQAMSFQYIFEHFQMQLNAFGNRAKTIDEQRTFNTNAIERQTILLSKLADADMGQVISDLTQKLTAIEATQQSYLRIQETFLNLVNRWNA